MIWLLGGICIAATLAFIGLWLGAAWLYNLLRDRYQARRKHVLHTVAADERVFPRTERPAGDKAQRDAAYDTLRDLPAPGETIYTDHSVWLPRTPQASPAAVPRGSRRPGTPPWIPSAAELDEWRERFLAMQGRGRMAMLLPAPGDDQPDGAGFCAGCWDDSGHCDGANDDCRCPCTWDEDWAEEHDEPAFPPEERCHCGRPAGHLAAALAGDHPETAFDTAQFEAVKIDV